jgi:hypothetical protein
MNLLETIFHGIADFTIKIGKKFKLSDAAQYRLLIALRVSVAMFIPIVGLIATIYPDKFNLRPDVITILTLGGSCAIFFYFIAKQYQIVFGSNDEIFKILNTKIIDDVDVKPSEYLAKRRMNMCEWLILGSIFASVLYFTHTKMRLLYAVMVIPAIVDFCFVILIVSWELNRVTAATIQKEPKTASE